MRLSWRRTIQGTPINRPAPKTETTLTEDVPPLAGGWLAEKLLEGSVDLAAGSSSEVSQQLSRDGLFAERWYLLGLGIARCAAERDYQIDKTHDKSDFYPTAFSPTADDRQRALTIEAPRQAKRETHPEVDPAHFAELRIGIWTLAILASSSLCVSIAVLILN
jgi:hypothetical protein